MKTVGILTGISYMSGIDYYRGINEGVRDALAVREADSSSSANLPPHSADIVLASVDLHTYVAKLMEGDDRDDDADADADDEAGARGGGGGDDDEDGDRFAAVGLWLAARVARYLSEADVLVIASNTGHVALPYIRARTPALPVLNIADATARAIQALPTAAAVGGIGDAKVESDDDSEAGAETGTDGSAKTVIGLVSTSFTMKYAYLRRRLEAHGFTMVRPRRAETLARVQSIIQVSAITFTNSSFPSLF
jgi:aspartate/glutamate racemase